MVDDAEVRARLDPLAPFDGDRTRRLAAIAEAAAVGGHGKGLAVGVREDFVPGFTYRKDNEAFGAALVRVLNDLKSERPATNSLG